MVAAFPLVELARLVIGRPTVVLYGDQALIAEATRRAAHFEQLLGPYSRAGFHHPGPLLFYLLAPFEALAGRSGWGLSAGAVTLNLAALVAVVVALWRRAGPVAAVWAAAALDVFCGFLGLATLREPWNPYLVIVPLALLAVVWAVGWCGNPAAQVWSLVIGSYEIQTHVATTPVVAVLWLLLAGRWPRRRGRPRRAGGGGLRAGQVILALVWAPPLLEILGDRPNNLQALWAYLSGPRAPAAWGPALRSATEALTVVPLGNRDHVAALARDPAAVAVVFVALAALAGAALLVGRRRRQPLAPALIGAALVVAVVGPLSLAAAGPVSLYFALWLSVTPLLVLLGLGVAVLGPAGPARPATGSRPGSGSAVAGHRRTAVVVTVASLAAATWTVAADAALPSADRATGSGPWPAADAATPAGRARTVADTAALDRAARALLGPGVRASVITIGATSVWPEAAGVVLELDEDGVATTVEPASWQAYFGRSPEPTGGGVLRIGLYPDSDRAAAAGDDGPVVARVGGTLLVGSSERTTPPPGGRSAP